MDARRSLFLVALVFVSHCVFHHAVFGDEPSKAGKDAVKEAPPLSGRIVDDLGKPVAGAVVVLTRNRFYRTKTDDDGNYSFGDIPDADVYRLSIRSDRCVGITEYQEQPKLSLDPKKPITKDFTLQRACRIKVKVVDENGQPVVASLAYRSTGGKHSGAVVDIRTDKEGFGLIKGLSPRQSPYLITAKAKGFAKNYGTAIANDPEKPVETEIVLKKGKVIRGTAICTDGNPPAGWGISASPAWDKSGVYANGVKIAEDGSFEIPDVGDGPHKVVIAIAVGNSGTRYATVLADANLVAMKQPISVKLDYPSPKSMTYLDCKIRWIGKPLERGFQVNCYCADLQHHSFQFVRTDKGNEFKIGPMPAGIYRIRPESSQLEVMNLRGVKNLDDLAHVKVPSDKPLQLVLRVKGKPHVQGKVVDAKTKMPIEDFRYRVNKIRTLSGPNYVPGDEWETTKSKTGEFREDVSGPGIYYVSVLADGYAVAHTKEVNTDETPDKVLEIALEKGVSLEGRVVDSNGNGIAGAKVRALSLAKGAHSGVASNFTSDVGNVVTDKQGKFRFDHLNNGYDSFRVDHPDYVYTRVSRRVGKLGKPSVFDSSNDPGPFQITLQKGATIEGRVFDNTGQPIVGETIYFQDNNGYSGGGDEEAGRFGVAATDQNGFYRVQNIPERTVYVVRNDPWQVNGIARHVVIAKDGKTHTLNFGGTTKVTGVYKVNGKPLQNTQLQLTGDDPAFGAMKMYCRTNDQGKFDFHGAPSGHWTLYRGIEGMQGEFVKVRDVDVPASDDLDLGLIEHSIGSLVVKCKNKLGVLPKGLRLDLQQFKPRFRFGRTAAKLTAREDQNDPFVFTQVSPGEFALVMTGAKMGYYRNIKITEETINQEIDLALPEGKANVKVELIDKQGKSFVGTLMLSTADRTMYKRMQTKTGDDGRVYHVATDIPDGKYIVHAAHFGFTPAMASLEVVDGKDASVREKIPKLKYPCVVSVTVVDEHGVLVPCEFQLSGEGVDQLRQRASRIERDIVGPEGIEYVLAIDHPGYRPHTEMVMQKPGKELQVVLKRK